MNYLIILFSLLLLNTPNETFDLTVTINNIKHIEGSIEIGLFNNGDRFMEEGQAFKSVSVKVKGKAETVVIKDLPKGIYAISLYHDRNSNGECDRNFLGIPKEPYAFSTNFKPKFSAPTFSDCQFELNKNLSLEISLIN
ncbi:MAG TPA: DUF2141 domain-containing protein [Aequorivita sp.]|nr:DUF2141 domain-containing protein [Aequorivita sp.]